MNQLDYDQSAEQPFPVVGACASVRPLGDGFYRDYAQSRHWADLHGILFIFHCTGDQEISTVTSVYFFHIYLPAGIRLRCIEN